MFSNVLVKIRDFFRIKIPSVWKKLGKIQKILCIIIVLLVFLITTVVVFRCAFAPHSASRLCFDKYELGASRIDGINAAAKRDYVKGGTAYYQFTKAQMESLRNFYENSSSMQICVRITLEKCGAKEYEQVLKEAKPFYFGFLSRNDFDSEGKFSNENTDRIFCGTDLRNLVMAEQDFTFDVSLALKNDIEDDGIPYGAFVSSSLPVRIGDFHVGQAKVGFDFTSEVPLFAVSPNGGNFAESGDIDFTGASLVFSADNTSQTLMPKISVAICSAQAEKNSSPEKPVDVVCHVNAGGEKLLFHQYRKENEVVIQTSLLKTPFCRFVYESYPKAFRKILMEENEGKLLPRTKGKLLEPVPTDPGLLPDFKNVRWRDSEYELYKWDRFPSVLIFDTRDYVVQDQFFKRLAFFAEKARYKGTVHPDEVIKDFHGFNAYDFSSQTMASFFNAVDKSQVILNEKEKILKEILLRNGVILSTSDGYAAGSGAVISLSLQIPYGTRYSLCAHELFHGLFFIDEEFRNVSGAAFGSIDSNSYDFVIGYFKSQPQLGYDTDDEYLMTNEFMAYVMQQHLDRVGKYFVHLGNRGSVISYMPELCQWVRGNNGVTFEDTGRFFESYVNDRWGLACGRVGMIVR